MNYSLNKLIYELNGRISDMEMPGFDQHCDDSWNGSTEIEIEFDDCVAIMKCDVSKSWYDEELNSREVNVLGSYLQSGEHVIPFNQDDIGKIENDLKL